MSDSGAAKTGRRAGYFLILPVLIGLLAQAAAAAEISGNYSALIEDRETRNGTRESLLLNYLSFDAVRVGMPALSLHGFAKQAYDWRRSDSATGIYYLYANHRSFEGRSDLKLGRFPLESHRFLTLDGAQLTILTQRPWGYSLYAGQPRYLEVDEERLERQFRDTGAYLAGGKIFLQGYEGVRANASYSREGGGGEIHREIVGLAGGKDFFPLLAGRERTLALDGSLDYSPEQAAPDRMSARLFLIWSEKLRGVLQADRYHVRDNYPAGREMIISLLSSGREDRAQYTLTYDFSPEIALYQAAVLTEMEMPDGAWRQGTIIKGGVSGNYREARGIDFDAGLYHFASHQAEATGVALSMRYTSRALWDLLLGLELVRIDAPFRRDNEARTISAEIGYTPAPNWKLAGYLEQSDNPEFKSDFRTGLRLEYLFGFSLGRTKPKVGP